MGADAETLSREYGALVARAAAAGLLPATGLTPREQCARLQASDRLPAADVGALLPLLEQGLYAGDGTSIGQAGALCRRLFAQLSEVVVAPEPEVRVASRWSRFVLALAPAGPVLGVLAFVGLAVLLTYAVTSSGGWGFSWGGGGGGGGSSAGASYASELRSVRDRSGDWNRSATRRTVLRVEQPKLYARWGITPGFDTVTGTDVAFTGRRDPISPALDSTHRLSVYTTVDPDFGFRTDDAPLRPVPTEADDARYVFRVDVRVRLQRGRPVPVPSPAADSVLLLWECTPPVALEFFLDGGDGLVVIGDQSRSVDLRYTVACASNYSFAALPDVPFVPEDVALPDEVRRSGEQVLAAIGDLPRPGFAATVRRLHAYFAGFSVCPLVAGDQRENAYLTIALARKGVCRHRARTFCITAAALGLRTRLVENLTHSFAEVQLPDGDWRRLEFRLGDGERPPVPRTQAARDAGLGDGLASSGVTWGGAGGVLLGLCLLFLMWRRHRGTAQAHRLEPGPAAARAMRRARRDHRRGWQRDAVDRLQIVVRQRLVQRLGLLGWDREQVDLRLQQEDVPLHVRHRLTELSRSGAAVAGGSRFGASDIQYDYWNAYHLLRWLDQEKPW